MSLKELAPTYWTRLNNICLELERIKPRDCLNVGCGDGTQDISFVRYVDYLTGIDFNKGDINIANSLNNNQNRKYFLADLGKKLPFEKESFDTIICSEVLEHLNNDIFALKEMYRVLKKNGHIIITVPRSDFPFTYDPLNKFLSIFKRHLSFGIWGWGHKRLYSLKKIKNILPTGLNIIKVKYLSNHLVGLIENSYVNSLLQRMIKNDPHNSIKIKPNDFKIKARASANVPSFLINIRNYIINVDRHLFANSKSSIGLLIVLKKE